MYSQRDDAMSMTDVRLSSGSTGELTSEGHGGGGGSTGQTIGPHKLPRTLSTSVLRIKHRSSFWEKFGADEAVLRKEV